MSKKPENQRPKDVGPIRVCERHVVYVEQCPWCNVKVRGEEHLDYARKHKVVTPVYRKRVVYKGKDYSKPTNPEVQITEEAKV